MSAQWEISFTRQAKKRGKRLLGDLAGSYSCRLTYKDRIVYSLDEERRVIYIERAPTHYGE